MRRYALDLERGKPAERERSHMGHHGPGWVKLWTRGEDKTQPHRGCLVNEQAQQFQGRWIDPMEVFHNDEDWISLCFRVQPGHEDLQRFLALPLGRQHEG